MAFNHEYPYTDPYRSNSDWLLHKVKEFGETLDSWKETIDALIEALKELEDYDKRITALENLTADYNQVRAKVAALESGLTEAFREIGETNTRIDNITVDYDLVLEELARLASLFKVYLKEANKYTDQKISEISLDFYSEVLELQRQIDELKELRPEELINPVRYTKNGLQKSYDLAYADMRDDALTNSQYAELGLTNNQYTAYGFTNLNFALHSRTLFKWDYVFGAVSGIKKAISNALSEVVTFIVGTMTNDQYVALDLTNDEYAALDLTNEEYLLYDASTRGLTNTEYSNILKSGGSGILRI